MDYNQFPTLDHTFPTHPYFGIFRLSEYWPLLDQDSQHITAVAYMCYLKNCSPTCALGNIMLKEMFTGKHPNIADIHEFRVLVWVMTLDAAQQKLNMKACEYIYVGLSDKSCAIHYLTRSGWQILTTHNFVFKAPAPVVVSASPLQSVGENVTQASLLRDVMVMPKTHTVPGELMPMPAPAQEPVPEPVIPRTSACLANKPVLDYTKIHNPAA
jgi:hypothetical protein